MIVITRNGKTTVYTGWRAWLIGAVALAVVWLAFVLIAAVFLGVAVTIGIVMLLLVPAFVIIGIMGSMLRR